PTFRGPASYWSRPPTGARLCFLWSCGRLDLNAGGLHLLERLQPRLRVYRGGQVDQDSDLEVVLARVERGGAHAVIGGQAADVDVVRPGLPEDVEKRMTAGVQPLETRVSGGVPALVDHRGDQLLADQVEDARAERGALGADDAVGRPGVDEVGEIGRASCRERVSIWGVAVVWRE